MSALDEQIITAVNLGVQTAIKPLIKQIERLTQLEGARLLNKTQSAAYLGISLPTFNNLVKQPGFPVQLMGFWARNSLDKWLAKR